MPEIELVFPKPEMKEQALDYRQEYFNSGETEIHGDGGLDHAESYDAWIEKIHADLTRADSGYVPAITYFAVNGHRIIGTVQIRHRLNEALLRVGGHIGYGVRPSERRKGYASRMLSLAIGKCCDLGIRNILVTCDKYNIGSARTIIKNNGVLENEIVLENGGISQRYWISVSPIKTVTADDLPECLSVIRQSFLTVADEFGLNKQNAPTNGAFIKIERLQSEFEKGIRMYKYIHDGKIAGFVQLEQKDFGVHVLERLSVLPEYRHRGFGRELLCFAKSKVREFGGKKITIGIIEENTLLKNWYTANGFVHTDTRRFDHLPFTVGLMESEV